VHFVDELNRQDLRRVEHITPAAMDALHTYPWPGNVRELHNAIEHAFVMGEGPVLEVDDLKADLQRDSPVPLGVPVYTTDEDRIRSALARNDGRKAAAAADLKISRTTLWRRLKGLTSLVILWPAAPSAAQILEAGGFLAGM
jgi:DNA-binding NtrC family response regulator